MIDKKFRKTHFPIEFCEMFGDCDVISFNKLKIVHYFWWMN